MSYSYGTILRYAAITVNTTIEASTLGYPVGLPIREEWQKFLQPKVTFIIGFQACTWFSRTQVFLHYSIGLVIQGRILNIMEET